MKEWLSKLGDKIVSSNRMIYLAGYCWWTLAAVYVWASLGYTEATFATFIFGPMTALFAAALGLKTFTDQKKIGNGKPPEGEAK